MGFINKNLELENLRGSFGSQHDDLIVVNNFLDEDISCRLAEELDATKGFKAHRIYSEPGSVQSHCNPVANFEPINDGYYTTCFHNRLIDFAGFGFLTDAFSEETRNYLQEITGYYPRYHPEDNVTATRWDPGTFIIPHTDVGLKLLVIISIAFDWQPDFGGQLIFEDERNGKKTVLQPEFNRAVILKPREDLTHQVLKIQDHCQGKRFTVALAYL